MDQPNIEKQVSQILALLGSPSEETAHSMVRTMVAVLNTTMLPKINTIEERLCGLEKRAQDFENLFTTVEQQRTQINKLEEQCQTLKEENIRLKQETRNAAQTALSLKRYSYQHNLLLHGISETHPGLGGATSSSDANFRRCVLGELQKFNAAVKETDFDTAHRLGPPRPALADTNEPAPRAILIKFYSRTIKENLLEASIRRYKELKSGISGVRIHDAKEPYLTSHRLRDSTEVSKTPIPPEDEAEAPCPIPTRKRRENLRSPMKTAHQIRQEKMRRQRK